MNAHYVNRNRQKVTAHRQLIFFFKSLKIPLSVHVFGRRYLCNTETGQDFQPWLQIRDQFTRAGGTQESVSKTSLVIQW